MCIINFFIVPNNFDNDILPEPDKFGYHNNYYKIERGWLTDETVIQFKLFNNPIKLWKNRLQNRKVHIKVCYNFTNFIFLFSISIFYFLFFSYFITLKENNKLFLINIYYKYLY